MPVIVLVADGARPESFASAFQARGGAPAQTPAMARLAREGGLYTVGSCFPSVTGPAYSPFLMGRYPGPIGLPGLRWYDRARTSTRFPGYARSYVGHQMSAVDRDLDPGAPTIFELVPNAVGALCVITRGLDRANRIGSLELTDSRSLVLALRAARTHFTGHVRGWLDIDREVSDRIATRLREDRPDFTFAALTGIDKTSHAEGHDATIVHEALGIVDDLVARIRDDAERAGTWDDTHLWVTSDHGHSAVDRHDDLAEAIGQMGHRVVAHPWMAALAPDVAVMVSGNAMAHLYVELERRERPFWPALRARWNDLATALLARPSVDLLLLPHSASRCEVRGHAGSAFVVASGGTVSYERHTGDPLELGSDRSRLDPTAALEATWETDYPDSLIQIAMIARAARSGDLILSASRAWDFRAHYEPIPHVSAHGALHREHMLVPLLVNRPPSRTPRRTVDIMPSALAALGRPIPDGLDGRTFIG